MKTRNLAKFAESKKPKGISFFASNKAEITLTKTKERKNSRQLRVRKKKGREEKKAMPGCSLSGFILAGGGLFGGNVFKKYSYIFDQYKQNRV